MKSDLHLIFEAIFMYFSEIIAPSDSATSDSKRRAVFCLRNELFTVVLPTRMANSAAEGVVRAASLVGTGFVHSGGLFEEAFDGRQLEVDDRYVVGALGNASTEMLACHVAFLVLIKNSSVADGGVKTPQEQFVVPVALIFQLGRLAVSHILIAEVDTSHLGNVVHDYARHLHNQVLLFDGWIPTSDMLSWLRTCLLKTIANPNGLHVKVVSQYSQDPHTKCLILPRNSSRSKALGALQLTLATRRLLAAPSSPVEGSLLVRLARFRRANLQSCKRVC
ncbi:hypothetical protein DFS34DRAFT_93251 [Phlyctochytrium arcticum]|nr:hypothetical protein DFS34DRAFT_93251 [Phlyctochytrium arcticum]